MNYVFITSTKEWGGIERWLVTLTNKLCEQKHNVYLLLIRGGSIPYPEAFNKDINVHRIKTNWEFILRSKIIKYLNSIEDPRVISFKYKDWLILSKIKAAHPEIKLYFSVRSTLSKGLKGNQRRAVKVSKALQTADKIFCISHGVAEHMSQHYNVYEENIQVIYNPLVTGESLPQPNFIHPWLTNSKPDIPTFIAAGRLVEAKGFDILIHAFGKVREKRPCHLIILGEGPLRKELEDLVKCKGLEGDVDLPGFVSQPKLYFTRANTFVMSSHNEGFGNVLVEALQSGIPVVSTDYAHGAREILENGRLGALVPPGDINAMATAMMDSLSQDKCNIEYLQESLKRFEVTTSVKKFVNATSN